VVGAQVELLSVGVLMKFSGVQVSSQWPVAPVERRINFSLPCSASCCSRILLAPVCPLLVTVLLQT
jgi:hypothetical protein